MPHDFLFNDKKPRTMEDGEFLDAVEYKANPNPTSLQCILLSRRFA